MATTSVTVLGTGLMGAGLAKSLARAGHDVTVWNRTPEKARQLGDEDGIKAVESLTDALSGADFVLTMLFDVPVLGTREPFVLAAGDEELRDRVVPVFDAIGSRTSWVGEQPGDDHRLKLVAKSWVLSIIGATAQSIGFADRLGVDPQLFLDVIADGQLDCGYAQVKGKATQASDFTPSFGRASGHAGEDMAAVVLTFTR
jgi:3-hydroxyisobutyrate dehydrogenase